MYHLPVLQELIRIIGAMPFRALSDDEANFLAAQVVTCPGNRPVAVHVGRLLQGALGYAVSDDQMLGPVLVPESTKKYLENTIAEHAPRLPIAMVSDSDLIAVTLWGLFVTVEPDRFLHEVSLKISDIVSH